MGADVKTNLAIAACEGIGLAIYSVPYIMKKSDFDSSPYSYLIKMNKELSVAWRR